MSKANKIRITIFAGLSLTLIISIIIIQLATGPKEFIDTLAKIWLTCDIVLGFGVLGNLLPIETKITKPESVEFYKFPTHIAILIDKDRMFSFPKTDAWYHNVNEKDIYHIKKGHKYNLYGFQPESYNLIFDLKEPM